MQNLFFKEIGYGNVTVVLIHGFCESHRIWEPLATKLSEKYRILVPDLPGFGESPLPNEGSLSIAHVGAIMLDWLQGQGIRYSIVIGHSLGGYVALAMGMVSPDSFRGVGLFHSTAYADSPEKKENRNKVIEFVARNGEKPFVESLMPSLFYKKDHPALPFALEIGYQTHAKTVISYTGAMRDRPDKTDFLKTFEKPILIVAGVHDQAVRIEDSKEQAKLPKHPELQILTESAHMGMFEQESESLDILNKFILRCI